jgi:hypothetical protein
MNPEDQVWKLYHEDNYILIIPDPDIKPHTDQAVDDDVGEYELGWLNCPCKPKMEFDGHTYTVIHNSFLNQERLEMSLKTNLNEKDT